MKLFFQKQLSKEKLLQYFKYKICQLLLIFVKKRNDKLNKLTQHKNYVKINDVFV